MNRSLVAVLMVGLVSVSANAQLPAGDSPRLRAIASQDEIEFPDKPDLLRRAASFEAEVREAQQAHAESGALAAIYLQLGRVYEHAGMYPKSEDARRHAVALLQSGPHEQLAAAISDLSALHMVMGELREAEKEELEVLRFREGVGDPIKIAEAWSDLAGIYVKEHHYKPALEYAQKALSVLGDDPKIDPTERIWARETLAYALCGLHDREHAIPVMKDTVELGKKSYGAESLSMGFVYTIMGYEAWQSGDMDDAADWMRRGTDRMKVNMGWGQPQYVDARSHYAQFLRERGDKVAAAAVEQEVRQANSVVDIRSLTGRAGDAPVANPPLGFTATQQR